MPMLQRQHNPLYHNVFPMDAQTNSYKIKVLSLGLVKSFWYIPLWRLIQYTLRPGLLLKVELKNAFTVYKIRHMRGKNETIACMFVMAECWDHCQRERKLDSRFNVISWMKEKPKILFEKTEKWQKLREKDNWQINPFLLDQKYLTRKRLRLFGGKWASWTLTLSSYHWMCTLTLADFWDKFSKLWSSHHNII